MTTCKHFDSLFLLVTLTQIANRPSQKQKNLGVSRGVVVLVGLLDCVDWFAQLCLDSKEVDLWCRGMDGMVGGNGPWLVILRLAFCWMKMATGRHFCATYWEKPSKIWDNKDHLKAKASCYVEHVVEVRR